MGCRGVHFAIDEATANKLLNAADDEELVEIVTEEIEEAWDEEHLVETDKAWDALHRCLSNGTLDPEQGTPPLNLCFFGGQILNRSPDYFVVLLEPHQVRDVASALGSITREWLRQRYFSLDFIDYQGEKSEEDFLYSWDSFQALPGFFRTAAQGRRYVIFTVDQ